MDESAARASVTKLTRQSFHSWRWHVSRARFPAFGERGVTLIEVLTAVAVIGILAGLLVPALSPGKARARSVKCQSNMRQIGAAMTAFANDHDMTLPFLYAGGNPPSTITWMQNLAPYVGIPDGVLGSSPLKRADGIFICPEFSRQEQDARKVSYAMNAYIDPLSGAPTWNYRLLNIPPASTFFLLESNFNADAFNPSIRGDVPRRHPGKSANFLFADGHIENISKAIPASDPRWHKK